MQHRVTKPCLHQAPFRAQDATQLKQFKVLANDFRGSPTQITLAVKAIQTLQHWSRDPFTRTRPMT